MNLKQIVRALFEQSEFSMPDIGLPHEQVTNAFSELVQDYLSEDDIGRALRAANVSKKSTDYRAVIDKIKKTKYKSVSPGISGLMHILQWGGLYKEAFLGTEDEALIRTVGDKYISKKNYDEAIEIFQKLGDSEKLTHIGKKLLETGKKLEDDYYATLEEEKRTKKSGHNTDMIPREVLKMYITANKIGTPGASTQLIKFADKLFSVNGVNKENYFNYDEEIEDPVLEAYKEANTKQGFSKAAKLYIQISEENTRKGEFEDAIKNLERAGESFGKAKMFPSLHKVAIKLAEVGDLPSAAKMYKKAGFTPTLDNLADLIDLTITSTAKNVKQEVQRYLKKKSVDEPFPTGYTFWHFSDSNWEWSDYCVDVEGLAGRIGELRTLRSKETLPIAKALYSSDRHNEKISAIHLDLQKHLLVGYMLSAASLEIKGPSRDRKYEHPIDAAWRTFSMAIHGGPYNPFEEHVNFKEDDVVMKAYNFLVKKMDQEANLMADEKGWLKHTPKSNSYLKEQMPKIQTELRKAYNAITERINKKLDDLAT